MLAELRKNFTVKECSLGTDPHEVLPKEGVYAPVVKAGSDEKNIFTCVVRKTDNDFMAFTQHRGKVFVVEKIPSFNLMSIKYLLPMVGGKIDGYYDVVRIGFTEKDGVFSL